MKSIFFFLLFNLAIHFGFTQTNTFPATGNTGIGTIAPITLLQVYGGISQFGGTSDYARFAADGDLTFSGLSDYLVGGDRYAFRYSGNQNFGLYFSNTNNRFEFRDGSASQLMWITASGYGYIKGRLAIGSTGTPGATLDITPASAAAIKINPYSTGAGNTGEMRFLELTANGVNYVGFKSADNISSNKIWILPPTDGVAGQYLKTDGAGNLGWGTDASDFTAGTGINITGTIISNTGDTNTADDITTTTSAGGDLIATYPNPTVAKIQGVQVSSSTPTDGQLLRYNVASLQWEPASVVGITFTAGTGINISGTVISNTGDINASDDANINLSNLTSTAINTHLTPATDGSYNLGNLSHRWNNIFANGAYYLDNFKVIDNPGSGNIFLGTTKNVSNTGTYNSFTGEECGFSNSTGSFNSGYGYRALYANTTAGSNSAFGYSALTGNQTGDYNVALGNSSMYNNVSGIGNCAVGRRSMYYGGNSNYNVAVGYDAMYNGGGATGYNVAVGNEALYNGGGEGNNTAVGSEAIYSNTGGHDNTAMGFRPLYNNTTGYWNIAIGNEAMYSNTVGYYNITIGIDALYNSTTGYSNVAIGQDALSENVDGNSNVAVGINTGTVGLLGDSPSNNNSTFIGYQAGPFYLTDLSLTNSTAIGSEATLFGNNEVVIGNSSVTSIGGYASWTVISDGRFKKNIQEDVPGLEFINKLQPVTYNLDVSGLRKYLGEDKHGNDDAHPENEKINALIEQGIKAKENIIYTGFIAQDVEKAAKEIGYEFSGVDAPVSEYSLYGLRYSDFVVPLVKAVQELDEINNQLMDHYDSLSAENEQQQIEINELKQELSQLLSAATSDGAIEVKTQNSTQTAPMLGQNIPNPFDNSTLIPFRIPKNCNDAEIMIVNMDEGKVITVVPVSCDETHIVFDAGSLASGTYNYSLIVNGEVLDTKQMVLTK